jgi:hypothetical protein
MHYQHLDDVTLDRRVRSACKSIGQFMLGRPLEVQGEFMKATIPGMLSTDSVAAAMAAFKNYVLAPSVIAQLPDPLRVDPRIPVPSETSAGVAYWVDEGAAGAVARLAFQSRTLGSYSLLMLLVLSRELLRRGGAAADAAILKVARRTVKRALDRAFLSDDAASGGMPAGILNGMITLAGGSPTNTATGLDALPGIVSDGEPASPVFICSLRALGFLAQQEGFREAKIGGNILGIPIIVSAAAGNRLILLDSAEVALFDGDLLVDRSNVATLAMSDAPASPASQTSLFQTDATSVKLDYSVSWATLSDDAVAALEITDLAVSPA